MEKIQIKRWPLVAIIGALCLVLGAGISVLWFKYGEQTAAASALPNAARIDRVSGEVGLNRGLDNGEANAQWINAEQNTPISVGDRIYTKENADASIAFSGRNFARLKADTSLDILSLSDETSQVALRNGSGTFEIGGLPSGDVFEVATPCGALDLTAPGLYQVEINDSGNATATAFSGSAQVINHSGTGRIEKGDVLTVPCDSTSSAVLSKLEPRRAGTTVDQYYRYRYPHMYDGRYVNYQTYIDDPFYYDPARRLNSYQYVSDYIPGVDDLDYYGDWENVNDYGECWHPHVDSQWAPYQSGYWATDYPYGLTWISAEPWGYAPYHYGRWAFASNNWYWVPDRVRTRPVYAPALVAFIPFEQGETIGWVPLGPGDSYAPRYYDRNWSPRYLTRNRNQERAINFNVPGAVTVVTLRDFNRPIDRRFAVHIDDQELRRANPVLDPFSVRNFRDAAVRSAEASRRFDVSATVAQRMSRPVITSTTPVSPLRRDLAQNLHVQSIPEGKRGGMLQIRDNRQAQPGAPPATVITDRTNLAGEQARERQMADLSREAARGNGSARAQMRELQQQKRQEARGTPDMRGRAAINEQRSESPAVQPMQGQPSLRNRETPVRPAQPQPRSPVTDQRLPRKNSEQRSLRNQERPVSPVAVQPRPRQAPNFSRQNIRQQQPRPAPRANVLPSIGEPRNIHQRSEPQTSQERQGQPKAPPAVAPPAVQPRQQQPPPQHQKPQRRGP